MKSSLMTLGSRMEQMIPTALTQFHIKLLKTSIMLLPWHVLQKHQVPKSILKMTSVNLPGLEICLIATQ